MITIKRVIAFRDAFQNIVDKGKMAKAPENVIHRNQEMVTMLDELIQYKQKDHQYKEHDLP